MLESKTQILRYLQKLVPSVLCAYRSPQTKFGVDTFIYKRNWSHFHTCFRSFLRRAPYTRAKVVGTPYFSTFHHTNIYSVSLYISALISLVHLGQK